MYFMSDPQTLHVTRNVIPGKLGVDLHLHRVHIPLVCFYLCYFICYLCVMMCVYRILIKITYLLTYLLRSTVLTYYGYSSPKRARPKSLTMFYLDPGNWLQLVSIVLFSRYYRAFNNKLSYS